MMIYCGPNRKIPNRACYIRFCRAPQQIRPVLENALNSAHLCQAHNYGRIYITALTLQVNWMLWHRSDRWNSDSDCDCVTSRDRPPRICSVLRWLSRVPTPYKQYVTNLVLSSWWSTSNVSKRAVCADRGGNQDLNDGFSFDALFLTVW